MASNEQNPNNNEFSFPFHELPAKMLIRPTPQTYRQTIQEYIRYYDSVISANLWDDSTAALYLPQHITDKQYQRCIRQMSPEQRSSYLAMKQILLDYDPKKPDYATNPQTLGEVYWNKLYHLRKHVHHDIGKLGSEIHGLVGTTVNHVVKQVDPQRKLTGGNDPQVVLEQVGQTVTGMLGRIRDTATQILTQPSGTSAPAPPPQQQAPFAPPPPPPASFVPPPPYQQETPMQQT